MKALIITVGLIFVGICGMAQDDTIHNFKNDSLLKIISPYKNNEVIPNTKMTTTLNGQHTLYNKNRQKIAEGIFKDNRFLDGKKYKYDENEKLIRIELYQNGDYIGDAKNE